MVKKPDNTIAPIEATFDYVVSAIAPKTVTHKPIKNKVLDTNMRKLPATPSQLKLDLGIEVEKSVGGIEMGVLQNGMPYLTQRGLAQMTGADRKTLYGITQEWENLFDETVIPKGRAAFSKITTYPTDTMNVSCS